MVGTDGRSEVRVPSIANWKLYDSAAEGLREYWYPVAQSAAIGRRPTHVKLCGQDIVLVRDSRLFALEDRCPHRCVPFSGGGTPAVAKRDFAGHLTCRYHGWVFELESGRLAAALTDGPDSPIVGKVHVRTYPVQERCGMVWLWPGEGEPSVPVEADIPEELLAADARVYSRSSPRRGNWRYATENGFDESHAKYLHRDSIWAWFRKIPSFNTMTLFIEPDGKWLSRGKSDIHFQQDYPGLGRWPHYHRLKVMKHPSSMKSSATSVRLPGILRVPYPGWSIFEWYVPVDARTHQYVQVNARWTNSLAARLRWWAYYTFLIRNVQHRFLNNQDAWMIGIMPDSHPERFFRPDASITAWRRLVETTARDFHGIVEATAAMAN
jgi:phenylpropionate dioxygenase-like ring-hydroxylating dioxygenase large terminal subunit